MPISIGDLIAQLDERNAFDEIVNSPQLQFGTRNQNFLGARLMPEQLVASNSFRDDQIEFVSVIANSGGRYSSVQKKGRTRLGSMLVELGDSDVGAELKGQAYDVLIDRISNSPDSPSIEAMTQLLGFMESQIAVPLAMHREKQRWDSIVYAKVIREGDGGYKEIVEYPNPVGHRVVIPGGTVGSPLGWYDETHDPIADIMAQIIFLKTEKGLTVNRVAASSYIKAVLNQHPLVQAQAGILTVGAGNTIERSGAQGFPNAIDTAFARNEIPPIETYDLRFNTSTGSGRYLPRDAFVMFCETGREAEIELPLDEEPIILEDVLGYTAIGRPVGASQPGVMTHSETKESKPPSVSMEGWQTSLPVHQSPEHMLVLRVLEPDQPEPIPLT